MKTILFLIQKEFLQIFRDKFMLRLMFAMPIIQLVVLAYTATYDIKNLNVHVIDHNRSNTSMRLINKLEGSSYFIVKSSSNNDAKAYEMLEKEEVDLVLNIPSHFDFDLAKYKKAEVQVLINAINGTKAGLANAYITSIIADFNSEIQIEQLSQSVVRANLIEIDHRNWYNPTEDYKIFMVPGILVSLVTLLSMFLSALNIVREKEIGTIEQLNVTTIKKHQFLIGKITPFGLIALAVLGFGLIVARLMFNVPVEGSLLLLFAFASIYILTALGLGIFISNISGSQQQAMFTSFFFIMIFILMSGLFTPIESMPWWAKEFTKINPLAYFIEFMRMVLLKGSTFSNVEHLFLAMGIYAVAANLLAAISYKKTSG